MSCRKIPYFKKITFYTVVGEEYKSGDTLVEWPDRWEWRRNGKFGGMTVKDRDRLPEIIGVKFPQSVEYIDRTETRLIRL